jgi:hypothetical protein
MLSSKSLSIGQEYNSVDSHGHGKEIEDNNSVPGFSS